MLDPAREPGVAEPEGVEEAAGVEGMGLMG